MEGFQITEIHVDHGLTASIIESAKFFHRFCSSWFKGKMPAVGGIVSNNGREYPGNLTPFVLGTCIVAAMGGLIFGYDIGISGADSKDPRGF
ncbi:hypothetical protein SAY86_029384 [Trapa natans]|uniref:Uncharacterized protein n=1 Tax=Trapa natans TaxID=22666 RepID=A0AAN7RHA4_TRANT|nr:hypothetical protein SAY86_029384 [Trapa natans]